MTADVVVLAVPGGPATHHLIGAEALSLMRPNGIFVNISRRRTVAPSEAVAPSETVAS
jgi:lactate dehydrogenase-like 2-hydroxyacid dehydrogenase